MKSKQMKRMITFLLALVMCMSLFAGCGSSGTEDESGSSSEESADSEDASEEDVEIAIGSTYSRFIGVFDSTGYANDQVNVSASYLVFDNTLYRSPLTGEWTSDILTEYYVTDDQSTMVLTLRDDVYFASGDQMLAEDILWTFQRQALVSRTATDWQCFDLDNAEISDDGLTLSIPLNTYRGEWKTIIQAIAIMNASWIEENGGDDFDYTDPSLVDGSGPYAVTEYVADISCTYEKRDDWWQEGEDESIAQASTIICYYYAESTTMMVDYENGVLDACLSITADNYSEVAADESLGTAVQVSSYQTLALWFNVDYSETTSDYNLRLAMALGTNAEDIAAASYGALGSVANGIFSSSMEEFYTEGYVYEYDPEQAAAIIEENGLEGTEITMIVNSGTNATTAEVWQAQMAEIGITVNIGVYDTSTCVELWLDPYGNDVMINAGDGDTTTGDPGSLFNTLSDSGDFPTLAKLDETYNALIDAAANGATDEERKEAYAELCQYIIDNAYGIPIAEYNNAYCYGASGKIVDMDVYVVSNANLRYVQVY